MTDTVRVLLRRVGHAGRRFVKRVGHRGCSLLFFGFLDLVYAFSLFRPLETYQNNPGLLYLSAIAPLWVFGWLWLIAGILCLANVLRANDQTGFTAAIAIKVLWGLLWLGAGYFGIPRSYISVTLWLVMAGFVAVIATWPEPTTIPVQLRDLDKLAEDINRLTGNLGRRDDLNRRDDLGRRTGNVGRRGEELDRREDALTRREDEFDRRPGGPAPGGD